MSIFPLTKVSGVPPLAANAIRWLDAVPAERFLKMSLTADIVSTVSGFFAERNYPESEAVLLVKELIEDLDGNPETYGVEESVARSYAWHKEYASQQSFAPDVAMLS